MSISKRITSLVMAFALVFTGFAGSLPVLAATDSGIVAKMTVAGDATAKVGTQYTATVTPAVTPADGHTQDSGRCKVVGEVAVSPTNGATLTKGTFVTETAPATFSKAHTVKVDFTAAGTYTLTFTVKHGSTVIGTATKTVTVSAADVAPTDTTVTWTYNAAQVDVTAVAPVTAKPGAAGGPKVKSNEALTFTAAAKSGFVIKTVNGAAPTQDGKYSIPASTANKTIEIVSEVAPAGIHKVTWTYNEAQVEVLDVTPASAMNPGTVKATDKITFTLKAKDGYRLATVTGAKNVGEGKYEVAPGAADKVIDIKANVVPAGTRNVVWNTDKDEVSITNVTPASAAPSTSKYSEMKDNEVLTFKAAPKAGYKDVVVKADGKVITAKNGVYTVPAGKSELTLSVSATGISRKVAFDYNDKMVTVTVDGKTLTNKTGTAEQGSTVKFTVAEKANNVTLGKVSATGATVTSSKGSYEFVVGEKDVTVTIEATQDLGWTDGDYVLPDKGIKTEDGKTTIENLVSDTVDSSDLTKLEDKLATYNVVNEFNFEAVELFPEDSKGNTITKGVELKEAIKVTISYPLPAGWDMKGKTLKVGRLHKGSFTLLNATYSISSNTLKITFSSDKFSTFKPVILSTGSTGGGSSSGGTTSTSSSNKNTEGEYFSGGEMYLVSSDIVYSIVLDDIAGVDEDYVVYYNGKKYTFNGKDIKAPNDGVIYYTAAEFVKIISGKSKVTSIGGSDSTDRNPDTGRY